MYICDGTFESLRSVTLILLLSFPEFSGGPFAFYYTAGEALSTERTPLRIATGRKILPKVPNRPSKYLKIKPNHQPRLKLELSRSKGRNSCRESFPLQNSTDDTRPVYPL